MNEAEIIWSKNHYTLMSEGGVWGVPRSGLVFKKAAGELILTEMMPNTHHLKTYGDIMNMMSEIYERGDKEEGTPTGRLTPKGPIP